MQSGRDILSTWLRTVDGGTGTLGRTPLRVNNWYCSASQSAHRVSHWNTISSLGYLLRLSDSSCHIRSIVRASVGAMTTREEVDTFVDFMRTTFTEPETEWKRGSVGMTGMMGYSPESETLYPFGYSTHGFPDVRELPRPNQAVGCLFSPSQSPEHMLSPLTNKFQCVGIAK